ncbi:unnamed protein product [Rhizophagus irregularis]|nr:unnamed protein product [Rhizophagus irregularis]
MSDIKCKSCNDFYTNIKHKWCKPCQISKVNSLKNNVSNCNSGNEKIDHFIQETQLMFERYDDVIVEWIPYNQFNDIKEINKSDFSAIYSAIWKDGPLQHDEHYEELRRVSNKEVILKYFYNLQNIVNDLLYEAKLYSIERAEQYYPKNNRDYLEIYGISQNPDTKYYILVFNDGYCLNCGEIYTEEKKLNNKWCKPCQMNNLKNHFEDWTSGNEKIDKFIQKLQLKINHHSDIIIEWIPYYQFSDIKKISKSDFTEVYSAKWKDGPLQYDKDLRELKRAPCKEIALKYFYNLQNIKDFLFEIKSYSIEINKNHNIFNIYGISQNPDTKNYIVILSNSYCKNCNEIYTKTYYKWCKPCLPNSLKINFASWVSGNKKIDELIQEKHIKINEWNDIIVEWIPYNQFDIIKEISKSVSTAVYSAIWKDGPLQHDKHNGESRRIPNKEVALKYLYNSQDLNNEFINEVKSYSIEVNLYNDILNIYGISQNQNTKDYIIVLDNAYCENCGEVYTDIEKKWCKTCQLNNFKKKFSYGISENETIDNFIQEMQLKVSSPSNMIVEWIPYNQFDSIEEIGKIGSTILYSAIWKDGPLRIDKHCGILKRISDKKVTLKYLHNSSNIANKLLNEFSQQHLNGLILDLFGLTQNPNTNNYILVFDNNYCETCNNGSYTHINYKWCKQCQLNNLKKSFVNWTSGNEKIDNFIQEMQLKINDDDDIIVEWIPYNQFNDIKEISKNDSFAVYSAAWKRGPLYYRRYYNKLQRDPYSVTVFLKYFYSLQNITNEIESYSNNTSNGNQEIYGVSQNSNTKDYLIVFRDKDGCCKNCNEVNNYGWCKPCQINNLKQNFEYWTSKNKEIDELIQKMQLKIDKYNDIIIEWISYNQFINIKEISKDDFAIIYSAIWTEGPLKYEYYGLKRTSTNKKVVLKYLCNSQDINEILNEIREHSISNDDEILNIYGISQNPSTKNYIIVLQDGYCKDCGEICTNVNKKWFEWIPYNQFSNIKEIGKGGFAIVYLAIWKDGPLLTTKILRNVLYDT